MIKYCKRKLTVQIGTAYIISYGTILLICLLTIVHIVLFVSMQTNTLFSFHHQKRHYPSSPHWHLDHNIVLVQPQYTHAKGRDSLYFSLQQMLFCMPADNFISVLLLDESFHTFHFLPNLVTDLFYK